MYKKRELLAQLNAKYGDDLELLGTSKLQTRDTVFDWRQTGHLIVDVLEASMQMEPASRRKRFKAKLTVIGNHGSEHYQATAWATGSDPRWNERLKFQRCSRHDAMQVQVMVFHAIWSSELTISSVRINILHQLLQGAHAHCTHSQLGDQLNQLRICDQACTYVQLIALSYPQKKKICSKPMSFCMAASHISF